MILKKSDLQKEIQKWRAAGQKIVLTNGCFDLIHVGHLRTFREAKKLGDILIVGINSDQSVRSLKGPTRPIISENERAELVAALKPVDHVIIFDELNVSNLLELVRPDYYVKGGDYSLETLPERDTIVRLNIKLKIIPLVQGISTSELVKKIRNANI